MIADDLFHVLNKLYPAAFHDVDFEALYGNKKYKIILIDARHCLPRLYGGKTSDWVQGGQWAQMVSHLSLLVEVQHRLNVEFVFYFDGAGKEEYYGDWTEANKKQQVTIKKIWSHIQKKGTPPPRAWFVPPISLTQSLSGALRQFGFRVLFSTRDHSSEVLSYIRSYCSSICALVSSDKYFLFNPLISSNIDLISAAKFRLDHDGRTVRGTKLDRFQLRKEMDLSHQQPQALVALAGNHILKLNEICSIVDPQYLRPSDEYTPYEQFIRGLVAFIKEIGKEEVAVRVGAKIRAYWPMDERRKFYKFRAAFDYYKARSMNTHGTTNTKSCEVEKSQFNDDGRVKRQRRKREEKEPGGQQERKYPLFTDLFSDYEPKIPQVSSDLFNLAYKRHKMGHIHHWIFPLLNTGDVYLDMGVEGPSMFSSSMEITRPLRQALYGLLFSYADQIHHHHRRHLPHRPILIREWHPARLKPVRVQALTFPHWKAPSLRQLWLGNRPEDYNRRVRAFLAAFMADMPMLTEIRPHLVVPCLVLRYLIQQKQSFLTIKHINVFLAVALSNHRNNMAYMAKLDPPISQLGISLSTLFLRCVSHASFANDICGQPLPPCFAAPLSFFDGKLFQAKLAIAEERPGATLYDLVDDGQAVHLIDRLRALILSE